MATIASLNVNMTASTAQLRAGLDRATSQNRRFARTNSAVFSRLSGTLRTLQTTFLGLFAGAGVGGAARLADQFTQVNNLLGAAGISGEELATTFERVLSVANETRSELGATGRLFSVLTRNSENLGASQTEILIATRAVQQSFALGGQSAQEAAGATRQLAQALASGQLRGQELNSILEQAPLIANAIASAIGVSLGELRMLSAEGRITSEVVFGAILASAEELNAQFQATTPTFSQLGTVLRNDLAETFGLLARDILPQVVAGFNGIANVIRLIQPQLENLIRAGILVLTLALTNFVGRTIVSFVRGFVAIRGSLIVGTNVMRAFSGVVALGGTQLGVFALSSLVTARNVGTMTRVFNLFSRAGRIAGAVVTALSIGLRTLLGPVGALIAAGGLLFTIFRDRFAPAVEETTEEVIDLDEALSDLAPSVESVMDAFEATGGAAADTFSASREELDGIRILIGEITEAEAVRDRMLERINELLANQAITQQQATLAAMRTNEIYAEAINEVGELGQAIETNISDALVEAFETGRFSLRDFTRDVLRSIIRIQAQMAASSIASSLFGGSTGFFSGLFGGARQRGGPVQAGQAYVVGEAGPELFVPNASGNIVANDVVQGGDGGAMNITINAVDTESFRQALARDPRFIYNLTQRGARAQGVMS